MSQALLEPNVVQAPLRIPVIDTDVHPTILLNDGTVRNLLSPRWQRYLDMIGFRNISTEMTIPPQREFTHRLDAIDSSGKPAVVPSFTRKQLVDKYDMSGVVLGDAYATMLAHGGSNFPAQLGVELCRAHNDAHAAIWFEDDSRFYGLINVLFESPDEAVKEIRRCKEGPYADRYVGVLVEPRSEYPIGNPKYWPMFEACVEYNVPLVFHTSPGRQMTASGGVSFYYEWHTGIALRNYNLTASFIFEGVFDQFPLLRVGLIEQAWSWAVPHAWRMDRAWKMLRDEIPDLQRKPSEYLRDHFWFATQPMEEPEKLEELPHVLKMFENFFGPDHLMFSSDYPHWDADSPYESVPMFLPFETRAKILGENASNFYKIPLRPGTGILAHGTEPLSV
jgi:predicted TIM-barrel fold metal-dependent hydrolase